MSWLCGSMGGGLGVSWVVSSVGWRRCRGLLVRGGGGVLICMGIISGFWVVGG